MLTVRRKIHTGIVILAALALGISSVVRYLVLDPVPSNTILVEQGAEMFDFHDKLWNMILFLHIATAAIPLIIGPFQFFKKFRNWNLHLHRNLGKLYVASIIISGTLGIYLSAYAYGGIPTKLGFLCLDVAWIWTTYIAYKRIRNKQVTLHERWMSRSYTVTFVAVTFRMWTAIIGYLTDNFEFGYSVGIWVALIGNLAVIELWLRKNKYQTNLKNT